MSDQIAISTRKVLHVMNEQGLFGIPYNPDLIKPTLERFQGQHMPVSSGFYYVSDVYAFINSEFPIVQINTEAF